MIIYCAGLFMALMGVFSLCINGEVKGFGAFVLAIVLALLWPLTLVLSIVMLPIGLIAAYK